MFICTTLSYSKEIIIGLPWRVAKESNITFYINANKKNDYFRYHCFRSYYLFYDWSVCDVIRATEAWTNQYTAFFIWSMAFSLRALSCLILSVFIDSLFKSRKPSDKNVHKSNRIFLKHLLWIKLKMSVHMKCLTIHTPDWVKLCSSVPVQYFS